MPRSGNDRIWSWLTLLLSCATIFAVVFSAWDWIEYRFFAYVSLPQLQFLYLTRAIASTVILAGWAVWFVLRERRRSEEELYRSEERYRIMLAHAADAVVLFDKDLHVVEWNPQASNLYGFSREDAVGQLLKTLRGREMEELRRILPQITQGAPRVELETVRRKNNGEMVDVQIRLSSFPDVASGQTVFLEVATDLREKIRLRQKASEIEKLASMGLMAAGTAHTLNTPLAAMLLRLDMLKERLGDHPHREEIKRLEASTRFCQDFVQKLLQFSRRPEAVLKCVEVNELLDSICTFFAPTFSLRGHRLSCDGPCPDGLRVLGDRNEMEALFAALLMNALDALPREGGTVGLGGRVHENGLALYVRDNGCGIPDEQLEHIFEPFFTTKKAGHGTGLGLSIARNIVAEHGGTIRLLNNSTSGVTAWVHLPLCDGTPRYRFCTTELCPRRAERERV
ncbi:MAG: PAS domain S-box protein [Acidobacteria bacterium]|nr:PAS domain S-box protein [Acidobacteriota bacterium]